MVLVPCLAGPDQVRNSEASRSGSLLARNRENQCRLLSVPVSVNSEVSNDVEVPPGVLIRALRAAPVGPCYTIYLKWFQLLSRWSYEIIG